MSHTKKKKRYVRPKNEKKLNLFDNGIFAKNGSILIKFDHIAKKIAYHRSHVLTVTVVEAWRIASIIFENEL